MAKMIGKMAGRDETKINSLRNSIVLLMQKTIELSIQFPVTKGRHIIPPHPYQAFCKLIAELRDDSGRSLVKNDFSFITFNYDLALDYALFHQGVPFQYHISGAGSRMPDGGYGLPLLKLHGSINWGTCQKCNALVPRGVSEARFDPWDSKYVIFDLGSTIDKKTHCDMPIKGPPILVPPTWNKTDYQGALAQIWKKAAEELAEAENIMVVGYSLPETDSFFRYLFSLGSQSPTRIKRFWVFNPDPSREVEKRFRQLIGRGIEGRFIFYRENFDDAIPHIARGLKQ